MVSLWREAAVCDELLVWRFAPTCNLNLVSRPCIHHLSKLRCLPLELSPGQSLTTLPTFFLHPRFRVGNHQHNDHRHQQSHQNGELRSITAKTRGRTK